MPADDFGGDLAVANAAAAAWCDEVNAAVHSEIAAVPDERLAVERDVLRRLPSLRPTHAPWRGPQGGQAGHGADRVGPLLACRTRCAANTWM